MNVTDWDRYDICMRYARTMMMMAKLMAEKYGLEDCTTQSYVKHGIESCRLAIYYRGLWEEDSTGFIGMVA